MTERVQCPHERLAVGHVERGAEQRRPEVGVLLRGHHGMDVAYADVPLLALGRHRVDPLERPLVVDQTERNAQDLVGCGESGSDPGGAERACPGASACS